jgi:hypothetical protein
MRRARVPFVPAYVPTKNARVRDENAGVSTIRACLPLTCAGVRRLARVCFLPNVLVSFNDAWICSRLRKTFALQSAHHISLICKELENEIYRNYLHPDFIVNPD